MGFGAQRKLLTRAAIGVSLCACFRSCGIFPQPLLHPNSRQKQLCSWYTDQMLARRIPRFLCWAGLLVAFAVLCSAQSNRVSMLRADGTWNLHGHIPLGVEALELEPAHRLVELMASAESPAFSGWKLTLNGQRPVLLDNSDREVRALPSSITFRVSASARTTFLDSNPTPFDSDQDPAQFLLGLHFSVEVFRGMQMRTVRPARQRLIGVPADEPSDARVYRVSFDLGDVRPEDRIVLLVTDASGKRLTKFHLEFL